MKRTNPGIDQITMNRDRGAHSQVRGVNDERISLHKQGGGFTGGGGGGGGEACFPGEIVRFGYPKWLEMHSQKVCKRHVFVRVSSSGMGTFAEEMQRSSTSAKNTLWTRLPRSACVCVCVCVASLLAPPPSFGRSLILERE